MRKEPLLFLKTQRKEKRDKTEEEDKYSEVNWQVDVKEEEKVLSPLPSEENSSETKEENKKEDNQKNIEQDLGDFLEHRTQHVIPARCQSNSNESISLLGHIIAERFC